MQEVAEGKMWEGGKWRLGTWVHAGQAVTVQNIEAASQEPKQEPASGSAIREDICKS